MEDTGLFVDFLNEFLQDKKWTIKQFAKTISCKPEAVGRWLCGNYLPSPKLLIRIAQTFNISIDYMFGLSDIKKFNPISTTTTFYERYLKIRNLRKYNDYQVSILCNLSNSSIYEWHKKKTFPHVYSMFQIAKNLECSLNFLFGLRPTI